MPQQTKQVTRTEKYEVPSKLVHPRRRDIFFHAIKTSRLVGALSKDRRVPVIRKICFFGIILALILILLFPDAIDETVLSFALPFVGTILGVPLDAGFDWIALALVSVSLLRIFPAEVVSEHYQRLFKHA